MEMGIIDLGNTAFFINDLSKVIDGVALVSDREKKLHASSPINR